MFLPHNELRIVSKEKLDGAFLQMFAKRFVRVLEWAKLALADLHLKI